MSTYTYNLVTVKDGVVHSMATCQSGEELELAFTEECEAYGVTPNDVNFDDGYMELECGTTICMVHAYPYQFKDEE